MLYFQFSTIFFCFLISSALLFWAWRNFSACIKGNSSESLVIDARINQQYFESKKAPRLEQEINLHVKVILRNKWTRLRISLFFRCTWSTKTSITYPLGSVRLCVRAWCSSVRCGFAPLSVNEVQILDVWSCLCVMHMKQRRCVPFDRCVVAFLQRMLVMDKACCVLLVRPTHSSPFWRRHIHTALRRKSGRCLGTH